MTVSDLKNRQAECQNKSQIEISKSMINLCTQFVNTSQDSPGESVIMKNSSEDRLGKSVIMKNSSEDRLGESVIMKNSSEDRPGESVIMKNSSEDRPGESVIMNNSSEDRPGESVFMKNSSEYIHHSLDTKSNEVLNKTLEESKLSNHAEKNKDQSSEQESFIVNQYPS